MKQVLHAEITRLTQQQRRPAKLEFPTLLGQLYGLLGLDKSGSRQAFKVRALIILAESIKRVDRAVDLAIVSYCANNPD
jgi:hypothetical protein